MPVWKEEKKELPKGLERLEKKKKLKELYEKGVDIEEVEIKKLDEEDLEEVLKIIGKFDIVINDRIREEVKEIIKEGLSYGAFVDRVLVSVALALGIGFDEEKLEFYDDYKNAVFLEDVFILLPYEGKRIREKLIEALEKEGKERGLDYIVYLYDGEVDLEDITKNPKIIRVLYKLGFNFVVGKETIAYKSL